MSALVVSIWDVPDELIDRDIERINHDIAVTADGCWLWCGPIQPRTGYGVYYSIGCRIFRAHRLIYRVVHGSIAPNLVLDHGECPKACVNPYHLDAVSIRENTLRGKSIVAANARKTHCKNGHSLSGDNLKVKPGPHGLSRICRTCWRRYHLARYHRLRKEYRA